MPDNYLRGRLLSFVSAPKGAADHQSYRFIEDGLIVVRDGRITAIGPWAVLSHGVPEGAEVAHYPGHLITPGFIDLHIHLPQSQVIASYGAQLMDWLDKYTFPQEQKFADMAHAERMADFFVTELLRNGTTTAVAYGSVHPGSVDALFMAAEAKGVGMIAGKVMMDRHAPPGLLDTAESAYADSKALIQRWHGVGRQRYAVTPRFAITSTEAQLEAAGALMREFPDVYLQTHLSENQNEIAFARSLFPWASSYTDIYRHYGLLGPKALYGHCIHLAADEIDLLATSGSIAVFCPTSNLFIGSGLFDLARLSRLRVGLATDVGGGTSYSMLATAAEGYKVLQLQGQNLSALAGFDLMTRRNAEALGLAHEIGVLEPGRYADLVVLDPRATPAMAHRMSIVAGDLEEELFILMTLGDDRAVRATYIQGRLAHDRDKASQSVTSTHPRNASRSARQ